MTERPAFEGRREHALGRDAQIHYLDPAHGRIGVEHEPEFPAPHGGRYVRLHRAAMDLACVGIEAGWDVDGHAQGQGCIDSGNGGRRRAHDLRTQPRAENRVDDDRRTGQACLPDLGIVFRRKILDAIPVQRTQNLGKQGGIPRQLRVWLGQQDTHLGASAQEVAGDRMAGEVVRKPKNSR